MSEIQLLLHNTHGKESIPLTVPIAHCKDGLDRFLFPKRGGDTVMATGSVEIGEYEGKRVMVYSRPVIDYNNSSENEGLGYLTYLVTDAGTHEVIKEVTEWPIRAYKELEKDNHIS